MIRRILLTIALLCVGATAVMATPAAELTKEECIERGTILTFKPWYANIVDGGSGNSECTIRPIGDTVEEQREYIWGIVLVIVEDIFQLAAYVAVGFIMYGGFLYLTSTGSPEYTKQALRTIMNAVIGLVVAISAAVIVGFIGGRIQ
ncbi:MAG: pilin [Candidatus Saccharibacteria bacterium]|nr:pilin [Candidatus Saccharibacteria bacterium]